MAEEKEHERIKQERLKDLEVEQERQRIEFEKQQRLLAEEKERQQREQERLQELKAEQERQRIEFEKQQRLLAEEKEYQQREQERLQELKAEKERQRKLEAGKKSPCEKIKDSLDKSLLNYETRKLGNNIIVLQNRQGIRCLIIPHGISGGCINYQIEQEGSSALCFYKECTGR